MKKTLLFSILAAILFASCQQETDIYQAESKLWKIRYNSEVHTDTLMESDELFLYDDKDVLTQIQTFYTVDEAPCNLLYSIEYNKDKTVSKVVHTNDNYTEEMEFFYNAKLLWRILYKADGATRAEIVFTRTLDEKEKHLSKITNIKEYYDEEFYRQFIDTVALAPLFDAFIGTPPQLKVPKSTLKSEAVFALKRNIKVEYVGNNISRTEEDITIEGSEDHIRRHIVTTYQYDNTLNPFYKLPFVYKELLAYSENNCTYRHSKMDEYVEAAGTWNPGFNFEEQNSYSRFTDAGYPQRKTTIVDNGIPFNTYYYYLLDKKYRD